MGCLYFNQHVKHFLWKVTVLVAMLGGVAVLAACSGNSVPAVVAAPPAVAAPTPTPASAGFKTLNRSHAHNDYEHTRPLLDALDQGFTSIEADVYTDPVVGKAGLYVAHDAQDIRPDRTLAALYLDPLKARVAAHGGCVYDNCTPVALLIDAKTDAALTYQAIEDELAKYPMLFEHYENGGIRPGPIKAILTGNRPYDTLKASSSRYCFYDGRISDLDGSDPTTLIPLVSEDWTTQFTWTGAGAMPADQKSKLAGFVSKAHKAGRRLRFYATPDAASADRDRLWQQLIDLDLDEINTDDLPGLRSFLLAHDPLLQ
jgi:hypothetical protein